MSSKNEPMAISPLAWRFELSIVWGKMKQSILVVSSRMLFLIVALGPKFGGGRVRAQTDVGSDRSVGRRGRETVLFSGCKVARLLERKRTLGEATK